MIIPFLAGFATWIIAAIVLIKVLQRRANRMKEKLATAPRVPMWLVAPFVLLMVVWTVASNINPETWGDWYILGVLAAGIVMITFEFLQTRLTSHD